MPNQNTTGQNTTAPAPTQISEAFFAALRERDLKTARNCLAQGMDPNAQSRDSKVPALFYALWVGSPVAAELIAAGADANFVDKRRRTALHWAARGGHDRTMLLALQHQDDINFADSNGYTPLHLAAGHGNLQAAILLITHGADLQARDDENLTPLEGAEAEQESQTAFALNALIMTMRRAEKVKAITLAQRKKTAPSP